MIAIGGYFRGPELEGSRIDKLVSATSMAVREARGDWQEGDVPSVIVLFVVPGSLGEVNFSGQRTTLFSRKKMLLQIEAAVPEVIVQSADTVSADDFVIDALRQASQTAAEHFTKKKAGTFDLAKAEAIIQKTQAILAARPR